MINFHAHFYYVDHVMKNVPYYFPILFHTLQLSTKGASFYLSHAFTSFFATRATLVGYLLRLISPKLRAFLNILQLVQDLQLFFQFSKSYTLSTYLACIYRTCIIRSHILSSKMHTRSHDICFCWIFYSIFFYQIRIFLDSWCFEMSHYMTQYKQTRTRKSGVQFITAFANGRRRKDGMVGKE